MPHRRRWPLVALLAPAVTALFSATVSWAAGSGPASAPTAPSPEPVGGAGTVRLPAAPTGVAGGYVEEKAADAERHRAVRLHLRRTEQPNVRTPSPPAEARPTPKTARRATRPSPRPAKTLTPAPRNAPTAAPPRREVKPAPKPRPKPQPPAKPKPAPTQPPTPAPAPAVPAPGGPPPVPTTGS